MAAAGRARVKSEFSLERMVDGYERVLEQIVEER
jgi:hypothetical protein